MVYGKVTGVLKYSGGEETMRKILKRICINKGLFFKTLGATSGALFSTVSLFLTFFSFEDIGIHTSCCKLLVIFGVFVVAVLWSVVRVNIYKKKTIVNEAGRSVTLRYGNLMDFAFPRKRRDKRIVVISVNTAFDTIVDYADVDKPLVSERTIHGQWIKQMQKHEIGIETIDSEIYKSLKGQKIWPNRILSKDRGKRDNYPKGTIASCTCNDTVFYLLALSEFDENNNAHNSIEELRQSMEKLIDYIDRKGQGMDVYMPVMGGGMSRTEGIDDRTALELLKFELLINKDKLHGNVNVVIYEKNRDKISLGG